MTSSIWLDAEKSRRRSGMPFIVKATNKKTGNEAWLAIADERGFLEHLFVIKALK
jgi:hypothetical protein